MIGFEDSTDLGVTVGKFMPYHLGHRHLIRTALDNCDRLVVLVVASREYEPDAITRRNWIVDDFKPEIKEDRIYFMIVNKDAEGLDDNDSAGWAKTTLNALGRLPQKVFTSEDYGPRWTAELNAHSNEPFIKHIMVDRPRLTVPISATKLRHQTRAYFNFLPDQVRPHYAKRVCIIGAESTGKTTLAQALADYYSTGFVREFGRYYTEAMDDPSAFKWSSIDFDLIAKCQRNFEEEARARLGSLVIYDTSVITTAIFHEAFLGLQDSGLEEEALCDPADLYILTDVETPFVQDETGIRMDDKRVWFHDRYLQFLEEVDRPYITVKGNENERLDQAVKRIDTIL